jgi:hypothetical protein
MKRSVLFLICFIFGATGFAFGQTKAVTNVDLEKFRQKRLQAEKEYRENYKRLGLPSPEELDRRREQSRKENEELSARLRAERLERERIEAEQEAIRLNYLSSQGQVLVEPSYVPFGTSSYVPFENYGLGYVYPSGYYGRRFPKQRFLPRGQSGYFAGGQFWPTPVRRPQPRTIFRRPRR